MKRALNFVLAYVAALALLLSPAGITPAYAQVSVSTSKTGTGHAAVLLQASAVAVILPSSGSSNASGQITFTTALPATPVGTVGVFLPAGVVTAGTQGTGAGVYQATCSTTTVCTLTGTVTTANAAYTQVTTEVVLATTTIPAGAMGLNGAIEGRSAWSFPGNVNTKTLRVRFGGAGGTQYMSVPQTANLSVGDVRRIRNRNSASSQVSSFSIAVGGSGGASTGLITSSVDTTVAQDLAYTGQIAVATDFLILEMRETWLLP